MTNAHAIEELEVVALPKIEVDRFIARIERLEKDWHQEHTLIAVLIAAGHITEHQVEAARSLIHETKD